MSYVVAAPEFVVAAAHDLATIGSNLSMANAAALFPTSGVMAAGADEISATIAALFGAHAQAYQALSAQAALFHQQFVQLMSGGAAEYAVTEAANASPLDAVQQGALGAAPAASVTAGMPATTAPAPTPAAAMGVSAAAATLSPPAALDTGERAGSGGAGGGRAVTGRRGADGDGVGNSDRSNGGRGGRTGRRAGRGGGGRERGVRPGAGQRAAAVGRHAPGSGAGVARLHPRHAGLFSGAGCGGRGTTR